MYWEDTGYLEKCVFGAELHARERKSPGGQDLLRRDAAERCGNTRILLSKQPFHPNVREATWQPATTHN